MKKQARKVLSLLLAVTLTAFSAVAFSPRLAAEDNPGPIVTVESVTAVPRDTVTVQISIDQNPGIMAMTFTIAYDAKAFTYQTFYKGILKDHLVVDHPDRGYISFVNCESLNNHNNGAILTLEFLVNPTATPGFHEIRVQSIRPGQSQSMDGCFANWAGTKIMPTLVHGGITVGETCDNVGHAYGGWETVIEPTCTADGVRRQVCSRCGSTKTEALAALGHDFETAWTVDRAATEQTDGVMSRHCTRCSAVTDKTSFAYTGAPAETEIRITEAEREKMNTTDLPDDPVEKPEDLQTETNEKSAEDLVKEQRRQTGIGAVVYEYLLGEDGTGGLLGVFRASFGKSGLSKPWWLFLLFLL